MNSSSQNLIDALKSIDSYPEKTSTVEFMQTQMSFVFLTDSYAYKIKKPVNLGYLDYTTLDKRLYFCNKELELNRRLAPSVYLAVLPVVSSGGRIIIGGNGEIIDYAVKMKRLPADRLMDHLLAANRVSEEMIVQLAAKLAAFHREAAVNNVISRFGEINSIRQNTDENFSQTEKYIGVSITDEQYRKIRHFTDDFMCRNDLLLNSRVTRGKIRDCHGDLHAAHICYYEGITIFDCIEFTDRFRYCDVASEVTFLAMDIDRFRRADLSRVFIDAYVRESGDEAIYKLLNFYKCYRAYVRGKVESFKLDDPLIPDKSAALKSAQNYFSLAERFAREKPVVLLMAGLVGSGKTTLAEALSRALGFTVISSDYLRKKLANIPVTEHRFAGFNTDIYSGDFTRRTYAEMFNHARQALSAGQWVILDASFKKKEDRIAARSLAQEMNADFCVVECVLEETEVKKRLEKRLREASISDGRWETYESQKLDFDPITEFLPEEHVIIDTACAVEDSIKKIEQKVV